MIEVTGLSKRYGAIAAVDDISFSIKKGELIGFLGPNGAGKTTTMNMLTGFLSMSCGKIEINGRDILDEPTEIKKNIGYLPETPPLYHEMTVNEYLRFAAGLKKIPHKDAGLGAICEMTGLSDVRRRLIDNLSKGYRQRVGLAQALIGDPDIIILDEPTVGLDPRQITEIRGLIKDLSQNRTIILSSHILPDIQAVCDRILIINRGRIIMDEKTENIGRRLVGNRQHLIARGDEAAVRAAVDNLAGTASVKFLPAIEEGTVNLEAAAKDDYAGDIREDLFRAFAAAGLPLLGMRPVDLSLETVFLTTIEQEDQE